MPETNTQTAPIKWSAPEFIHYPKNIWWFVLVILLGLMAIGYFVFHKEYLTAGLFFLIFAILFYFARATPRTINIELNTRGIKLNETSLSYQQIKTFWLVYDPPFVKTLNLETTTHFNRIFTLQLMDQDPIAIRKFLLEYLPEDLDRGEAISDKIARTLKF